MNAIAAYSTMSAESAMPEAICLRQKLTYAIGVYLMLCYVAVVTMFLVYEIPYIWWWSCSFVGIGLFVCVIPQYMCEAIEGKKTWSKFEWKVILEGVARFTVLFCAGSPLVWWRIVKAHECADLKGPMQYICPQEGGKEASAFYSPEHDVWNTDSAVWIILLPMLLVKICLYETLFDLGFYLQHRLYHEIPWLYRMLHKEHHTESDYQKSGESVLLKSWHTYHGGFVDMALVFSIHIPCMAWFSYVFGSHPLLRFTGLDASIIFACMTCWEQLGHVDSVFGGTIVMPATIIISKVFGIQGFGAKEHVLHHLVVTCNYSKRFLIWDRFFGTMKIAEGGVGQWRPHKNIKGN